MQNVSSSGLAGAQDAPRIDERSRCTSAPKIEKAAVQRIVRAGDKGAGVGTQKKSQGSDLLRLGHAADGLGTREAFKIFLFLAGIMFLQIAVNKRGMHAGRRNAVAPDIVLEIVFGYRISHSEDGAFGRGVGEAIREPGGSSDGSDVQNDAATIGLHVRYGGLHTKKGALDVDAVNRIEIALRGGLQHSDVRNPRAIDEDVYAALFVNFAKCMLDGIEIGYVAHHQSRATACALDLRDGGRAVLRIDVKNMSERAARRERESNGAADATRAAGDDSVSAIQPKIRREVARFFFQGMLLLSVTSMRLCCPPQ